MKLSNLDDLHLFVSLVEAGSFTLAAKELGIAKSKLSRRLVLLEKKLGCELLLRTTRKQELTESGRLLFCASKEHIDALTKVEEQLFSSLNQVQGKLNILLPLEFFNKIISTLIGDFLRRYPKINLNCQHYSGAIPEFDPKFDLCFVLHEQVLPSSNWIAKELVSFPQSIYFSPLMAATVEIKLLANKKVSPEQLSQFDCILADENQPWHFRNIDKVEQVNVSGKLVLSSPEMRLQAAEQGLGLCKLPDYVVKNNLKRNKLLKHDALRDEQFNNIGQQQGLQRLSLSRESVAQRLSVLYQSRNIARKTRTFLDYFQSNVGKLL
ncbi:LysR family transcriptional regulator [Colwellia psychrerythraea]|uniref:Transcriptional regulator, LysR family n=1 Tax=Colwellia psychrerythraea TaxID=28229 RepID=A0A099KL66_COLPS|nr:LysR family transcriptional regulator [Colwellia psychrerythraea]KGJ90672.1 transcriptional regulator, LysR family [Colwellia psychrerythraea]